MLKFAAVIFAVIACAAAKPGLLSAPLAYTVPAAVVAAPVPVVTATSHQFIARNHNGVATAPIVAPVAAAPLVAKTVAAYTAPVAVTSAAHFTYSSPVVAKYSYPLAYSAPLTYAAAASPVLL